MVIDLVNEEITCIAPPLTLDVHKAKAQIHLHCNIASDMGIAFKKQATTKATEATVQET